MLYNVTMRKLAILFFILAFCNTVYAASINAAAYRTMQMQSYQRNYAKRQSSAQAMPYWQAQSNYATRNRTYTNYQNYSNYQNAVNQYNYSTRSQRSRY